MTTFEIVKTLSEKQGVSIVELEEKLGFSRNSLYAWKKSKPSVDKLEKVADYFNVSTDYLLGRTDVPNEPVNSRFTTLAAHAANRDHKVTDEELNKIEAYLDGLIDSYDEKNKGN
ncbi:helix-turn-helix domain-containing protein [Paucilactobacillus kaifaensis]|uniref:helix-turn-helix domain-containing protein n=1 Tax=Paucilactobacillus kaifaensis TaxID=2559921 RepID=UPI0010F45C22|nr:helix-turn-helix transcriptional regulator [Paucilactobacillus kaifaensis]